MRELIEDMQADLVSVVLNLNCGGCAKFAYFLSRNLSRLNIPHQITLCDYSEEALIEGFEGWHTVSHVLVYMPGIGHIDGYRTYSNQELLSNFDEKLTNYYDLEELCSYAFGNGWNPEYDIDQNDLLESIINKYINEEKITRVNLSQQEHQRVSTSRKDVLV